MLHPNNLSENQLRIEKCLLNLRVIRVSEQENSFQNSENFPLPPMQNIVSVCFLASRRSHTYRKSRFKKQETTSHVNPIFRGVVLSSGSAWGGGLFAPYRKPTFPLNSLTKFGMCIGLCIILNISSKNNY